MKITKLIIRNFQNEYSTDLTTSNWVKTMQSIQKLPHIEYCYKPHYLLLKYANNSIGSFPLEILPHLRQKSSQGNVLAYSYYDQGNSKLNMLTSCNGKWLYHWSISNEYQLSNYCVIRECYCLVYFLLIAHTLGANKLILVHPYRYPYEVCSVVRNSTEYDKELTTTAFEMIQLFKGFEMEVLSPKLIKTHFQAFTQSKLNDFYYFKNDSKSSK